MTQSLTWRQKKILEYIKTTFRERGYSPTVREIGKYLGLSSSSTVHNHIQALKKKGYLENTPSSPRTYRLTSYVEEVQELINRIQQMDDDVTDMITIEGEPYLIKRASEEDIREWKGAGD